MAWRQPGFLDLLSGKSWFVLLIGALRLGANLFSNTYAKQQADCRNAYYQWHFKQKILT
jgi:hypothetical protein